MPWRSDRRDPAQTHILDTALARARRVGPEGVAVFDLDSCLFDPRPRQQAILRDHAARGGPAWLTQVQPEHFVDWHLDQTLRRAGVPEDQLLAHLEAVRRVWTFGFFSGDFLHLDHPLPGAVDFVSAVASAGLTLVYLTGRDHWMAGATGRALHAAGFPWGEPHRLMVKPDPSLDDTQFKAGALEAVAQLGQVCLFFDNEPANVNVFAARHPEALVVFVDTDHSPRPERPDPALPVVNGFLR